jgi:hypothetical protein
MSDREDRFYSLLNQPKRLEDNEIQELRELMSQSTFGMVRPHVLERAQLRVQLDLMESIRQFDKASGRLVETTNTLTRWILRLTLLAAMLGIGNVIASAWPYLTWWVKNDFHLH